MGDAEKEMNIVAVYPLAMGGSSMNTVETRDSSSIRTYNSRLPCASNPLVNIPVLARAVCRWPCKSQDLSY